MNAKGPVDLGGEIVNGQGCHAVCAPSVFYPMMAKPDIDGREAKWNPRNDLDREIEEAADREEAQDASNPKQISAIEMLVRYRSAAFWPFSHASTCAAGGAVMNS